MRLGQLARKLSVRPDQIVDYLLKFNITLDEGSNARIEDNDAEKAIAFFAPTLSNPQVQELLGKETLVAEPETVIEEPTPEEVNVAEAFDNKPEEIISEVVVEVASPVIADAEMTFELGEVIKAPKVELPGLRVIGKIELPQPKKKEEDIADTGHTAEENNVPAENISEERKQPRHEPKTNRSDKNRNERERPRKNPIALQREREAREGDKKKREEEIRSKELRAVHYAKKIKQQAAPKSTSLYRDEAVEVKKVTSIKAATPSAWQRFKKWFWRK